ncbi:septin-4-like isoform X2 [Rhinatrema bivittatum]|uniref:septin-4-like isoform X2 n=1 Tax=Rhinatrema bivittatum TaxID=194408 RepID=UPI0011266998|nr:septin-4-like isoform X2 [Rhinatrema bivittatum]
MDPSSYDLDQGMDSEGTFFMGSTNNSNAQIVWWVTDEENVMQCLGVGVLSDHLQKSLIRRGLNFTLMVAGESGLGKSTLIKSLFQTDVYKDDKLLNSEAEPPSQTVRITKNTVKIVEEGLKVILTVVDTPGFGDAVNNTCCWKSIADYVDQQFEQYFRDESGLNRKNILDNRVNCCLYFISPFGHGLRPLDVEFMKALHERVNIVPILAKADTLTRTEVAHKKRRIQEELEHFGIQIYPFSYTDSDDEDEFRKQNLELKRCQPFAVIASNTLVEKEGKRVLGRLYPWGIVEVEDPAVSDLMILRAELKAHMQRLKDVTQEAYENYRLQCLQKMTRMVVKDRHGNYVPGIGM